MQSDQPAYQQSDPPTVSLRRDSAELFVKEVIPSLKITLVNKFVLYILTHSLSYSLLTEVLSKEVL